MCEIFISYAHQDKETAELVCTTLEQNGHPCWIAPRDILPGRSWSEAIIDGIESSRLVLLVFSDAANESPQVCREVERAVHKGVPILPLRVENVLPDKEFEYFLGAVHWLDAWTPNVEAHLPELVRTVTAIMERPVPTKHREMVAAAASDIDPNAFLSTMDTPVSPKPLANGVHTNGHHNGAHSLTKAGTVKAPSKPTTTAKEILPEPVESKSPEDGLLTQSLVQAGLELVEIKAGDLLFRQGDPGDSLYILERGKMTVNLVLPDGEHRQLFTVEPMAIIGEMSLLLSSGRTATIIAQTDVTLWRVGHDKFQDALRERERWAIKLLIGISRTLARHVESMNNEIISQNEHIEALKKELHPNPATQEIERLCDRLFNQWAF
jgi:CRP-like cAMP-binding protein